MMRQEHTHYSSIQSSIASHRCCLEVVKVFMTNPAVVWIEYPLFQWDCMQEGVKVKITTAVICDLIAFVHAVPL